MGLPANFAKLLPLTENNVAVKEAIRSKSGRKLPHSLLMVTAKLFTQFQRLLIFPLRGNPLVVSGCCLRNDYYVL